MKPRAVLILALTLSLSAPLAAEAQQPAHIPRIGVLLPGGQNLGDLKAFREGLEVLGHVDGKTIVIDWRLGEGRIDRHAALVLELIRLPVDVIVVGTTGATLAAKQLTTTIPIVAATAGALVEAGVVASLAHPGGNVTGLTTMQADLHAKRLELLKEAVPKLSRVSGLASPYGRASLGEIFVRQTETAARALGIQFQLLQVQSPADLEEAFQAAVRGRSGAVIIISNPFFSVHAGRVAELALRHHLPMMANDPGVVEAGGLMQYWVDYRDMWRRAASYVDRILKGAKPADLPVEQPTKFELVINLKTAKALGLTIPPSVLLRADQLIE